jgi:hypothetical protein
MLLYYIHSEIPTSLINYYITLELDENDGGNKKEIESEKI